MIRINLIAKDRKNPKSSSSQGMVLELVVLGLLLLFGAAGVFFWYSSMEDRIAMAKMKVSQEKATIVHLGKAKATLKQFQDKEKELKRQLDIINKLKNQKQGPVRVLDQISVRIPKQVWLTSVRQQKKGHLMLYGEAENNESVAIFLKRLEDSPYFETVDLQQIIRRSFRDGNRDSYMKTIFSVSCKVRFTVTDS